MTLPSLRNLAHALGPLFDATVWAKEEITAAQQRHPDAAALLGRSFPLLKPTSELMRTAFVYRAHCAELLDRVAAGHDTRPGTATECCIALCVIGTVAPLHGSAVGLCLRLWRQAGLPAAALTDLTDAAADYEARYQAEIDDGEALLRVKLAQQWRVLAPAVPSPRRRRG